MADGSGNTELTSGVGAVVGGPEGGGVSPDNRTQNAAAIPLAGPQEASLANAGIYKPDKARDALQELAGGRAFVIEILRSSLGREAASLVLETIEEDLNRQVEARKILPQEAEKALKILTKIIGERAGGKEKRKGFDEVITEFKQSQDPFTCALGYDIEISIIGQRVVNFDEQIKRYDNLLSSNDLSKEQKALIKSKKDQLERMKEEAEQKQKKLQEERGKLKGENGEPIPDQVKAQIQPIAREVVNIVNEGKTLTDEEKQQIEKQLEENPIGVITETFREVVNGCIEIKEEVKKGKGTRTDLRVEFNQEKFNQFISKIKEAGFIDEQTTNSLLSEYQQLVSNLANLGDEEKRILRKMKIEKTAKKGLPIVLGIFGLLAVLVYVSSKKESGGQQRGMM
ncbi:MAG: hypothetical protein QHH09_02640 [Microgenomates group bacterium]|jgi:hypothetical protein|nr:hypothetical protein [Microgenomates group bacterium]